MQIVTTVAQARALFDVFPGPIGFVPTMGALHEGHLELMRCAREESVTVGASIFVNPMQFGPNEDFAKYPREFERDCEKLTEVGVDVLFAPTADEMFAPTFSTAIDVGRLGTAYEGAVRPEHFRGVATIVTKLLNVVRPAALYLGQKDAQQTAVLRRAIRDLDLAVHCAIVPTVREPDGLALSSRNVYLSVEERAAAPTLHRALAALNDALSSGASKSEALERARATISPLAQVDYFDVVDVDTFEPLETLRAPAFTIGAARFGTTRLLDNLWTPA